MTLLYNLLAAILMGLMLFLMFVATSFVSAAKYNGYGIWHLSINAYFRGRNDYRTWLHSNTVYLWSCVLIISLIVMILILVSAFSHGRLLIRPDAIQFVSPIFYFSLIKIISWFVKRIR